MRQRRYGHRRGVGLALLRVTRDVGRCEQGFSQQFRIEVRFVLPNVEGPFETAPEQGCAVNHLPARGVHHDGAGFHPPEQLLAGHAARRVVERGVEREDVGLAGHLLQRQESAPLPLLARRVAAENAESPRFGISFDERPDVSHAHDAQRPLCGLPALCAGEVDERGGDPLQDAPGVASGGCRDRDSVRCAPRRVDVVESDGRRGDEAHPRTGEQRRVAPRAGAGQERVGVADVGGRNGLSGEITHLGERFQNPFQEGNGTVGYDFHDSWYISLFLLFRENKYR